MSKGKRASSIKMIPIDRINILNPRVRNQKSFEDMTENIVKVGLKRPITVTQCLSSVPDKDYDLVCGQGRIEAFLANKQSMIPAVVIEAGEEEALVMSLVENLARCQHTPIDLLQAIRLLKNQGYDYKIIADKIGLSHSYVNNIIGLLECGEDRLLSAVESGAIPIGLAMRIANTPGEEQSVLREAYENKILRGKKLMMAKRLIEMRRRYGKGFNKDTRNVRPSVARKVSVQDVLSVYQREVDRKRLLARKADFVRQKLAFVVAALHQLLEDDDFTKLLNAEGLTSLPKPIALMIEQKEMVHA